MKELYLSAVDQGTSNCRASLVDGIGLIIDIVQIKFGRHLQMLLENNKMY